MSVTSATLLERLKDARDADAWSRLVEIYAPLIRGWAERLNVRGADADDLDAPALRTAWESLSRSGTVPLAVRSSSPVEDTTTSSMAGRFHTSLDVVGWPAFQEAVRQVAASAGGHPMGVLVQPMLDADLGGILFGVDPDGGDGSLEWALVVGTGLVAVTCLGWARVEWRRAHLVTG